MGKRQRERGAETEREVANYLASAIGVEVKRKLGQARDSGEDISLPPFRMEVKRRKKLAVMDFMRQCEKGSATGEVPLVVMRVDSDMKPLVMMRLEDFVPFMRTAVLQRRNLIESGGDHAAQA